MKEENILEPQKPENIIYIFRGFAENKESIKSQREFEESMNFIITEISKNIDIRSLDGITITHTNEYDNVLAELDRGVETNKLTRSTGEVIGVAITPAIIRNNDVKSHIIYDYSYISEIINPSSEHYNEHLYTFTHELAHVEITNVLDKCFPNTILREKIYHPKKINKSLINMACLEEYLACRISGGLDINHKLRKMYEETLINCLLKIEFNIKNAIIQYEQDKRGDVLFLKMYTEYGNLLKYSSYYLGHIENQNFNWEHSTELLKVMKNEIWFKDYFLDLREKLNKLWLQYNKWCNKEDFDVISDIAEEMIHKKVEFLILFNILYVKIK